MKTIKLLADWEEFWSGQCLAIGIDIEADDAAALLASGLAEEDIDTSPENIERLVDRAIECGADPESPAVKQLRANIHNQRGESMSTENEFLKEQLDDKVNKPFTRTIKLRNGKSTTIRAASETELDSVELSVRAAMLKQPAGNRHGRIVTPD